jgi:hypothetical protein
LLEAQTKAAAQKAERIAAVEGHLSRMKELEQWAADPTLEKMRSALNKGGISALVGRETNPPPEDVAVVLAGFYRAEAEFGSLRRKRNNCHGPDKTGELKLQEFSSPLAVCAYEWPSP